jgi:acyl carrier protein
MQAVAAEVTAAWPPVGGVVHAAGVVDDRIVVNQTPGRMAGVLASKVTGAWHLHQLLADAPLDFFVLFSSAAALFGAPGQANHAAANAFLGAFAHARRALGLPATTIDWGGWTGIGAADRPEAGTRLAKLGMDSIDPGVGLSILGALIASGVIQAGVFPIDWRRFREGYAASSLFKDVLDDAGRRASGSSLAAQIQGASGPERLTILEDAVRGIVASVLGFRSAADVPTRRPLFDLGIDSLTAVELRNRLASVVDRKLPTTIVFDYPTAEALTHYLAKAIGASLPSDHAAERPADDTTLADEVQRMSTEEITALIDDEFQQWT